MFAPSGSFFRLCLLVLLPVFIPGATLEGQDAGTTEVAGSIWATDFSRTSVDMEEIMPGGPTKDGIPAIDHPRFETVEEAGDWLTNQDPVAVVRIGDHVKVYPLQILIWHEIVNDEVGGVPVSVTFCPLCNTTLAFRRVFDGTILDFGTTGLLRHSDMVMYDRQTESWWQQATGEGIVGTYSGRKLSFVPAPVMSWKEVRKQLPHAQVLSKETGFRRAYGENPYRGYDRRTSPFFGLFRGKKDDRLGAMERVVALEGGAHPIAIPFSILREKRVVHVEVDGAGEDWVVFWAPGTASALDSQEIPRGRDVGATGVFSTELNGRTHHFRPHGESGFQDEETGTVWSLTGDAVEGPLAGKRLAPIPHGNHFWFAWVVFRPETEVWAGG